MSLELNDIESQYRNLKPTKCCLLTKSMQGFQIEKTANVLINAVFFSKNITNHNILFKNANLVIYGIPLKLYN